MDDKRIPRPTEEERRQAIQAIVDQGLPQRRQTWPSLWVLFFGVEDSLILAGMIFVLCLIPALGVAKALPSIFSPEALTLPPMASLTPLLFLLSPLLYAALQILTNWKESIRGTLEWKRSCTLSLETLLALRTLVFGGFSAALCVPVDLLLWQTVGQEPSLLWMVGVSLSSLFLYAALTLAWQNRRQPLTPLLLWIALGFGLTLWRPGAVLLYRAPALVFLLLAALALAYSLHTLRQVLQTQKGAHYGTLR